MAAMEAAAVALDAAAAFRKQFPIFEHSIYLSSCSQGALARPVEAALREFMASWHEHGNPWELWVGEAETLRTEFARLINASPQEIAITFSVSSALNSLASALSYTDRPAVVLAAFDFPTRGHVWLAQQRRGAEVRFARAQEYRLPLRSYQREIRDDTSLVATTHVCYRNGFKTDVAALAEVAHERGALLLVDAYQSLGTQPMNVKALGLDFMVTGALKYLLGTPGIAFLYVGADLVGRFQPSDSGWFAQEQVFAYDVHHLDSARSARRFETGSPPVPNAYATLAALRLLASVGQPAIERHVQDLSGRLIAGARRRGFTVLTPEEPAERGPLVMIGATDATRLVEKLAAERILCSTRDGALRVSFHYYNTSEDVDAVLDALDRHAGLVARG